MAKIEIKNPSGGAAGQLELADALFAARANQNCVRACYNQYMANQRAGTHSTKTRGMVSGGGKKPWRQKGTGRARCGSNRSPIWRGGAILFGPSPRDYSYRVNKKVRHNAIASLLSSHLAGGTLIVVDGFGLEAPKTKDFVAALSKIGALEGRKVLVVNDSTDESLLLSARNLQNVKVANANNLNVFDLLVADRLVLTKGGALEIQRIHGAEKE